MTGLALRNRLIHNIRNRHLLAGDAVLVALAVVLAFGLRLDTMQLQPYMHTMLTYALVAPLITLPIFAGLGLYSRLWRYASVDDLLVLIWAAFLGGMAQGALLLGSQAIFQHLMQPPIPRSIPLIAALVTLMFIAAPRFALRMWWHNVQRSVKAGAAPSMLEHVLIVGAGEAGVLVLRELRANPQAGLMPVGFADDDPSKHGVLIQRARVFGGRDMIPALVRQYHIEQVIIAMPSAAGQAIREIVAICDAAGVRARIIPGMYELLDGSVKINQLRDVQIDDLLRREPVDTDTAQVAALVRGKRVLITGAGGSIGAEMCRQILRLDPAELILLGHGENSIFDIYNELRAAVRSQQSGDRGQRSARDASRLTPVIADVRFPERMAALFAQHRPEIVFHAAAHKHVPLMEKNIEDAVTNNVLGTQSIVTAAVAAAVAHFVLISTDKAVNPSSVMGASKRVAELIVQDAAQRTGRAFVAVRFGNVLGSRGSVVPFFQKQIAAGGPVTVTHPEMRRYFMTIPEAVQLVLQAAALGKGGEVFVLDMGEPVRIADLAEDLIRLSGLEPGRDVEIRYTGLRPGEKLFEELFGTGEHYAQTQHQKIFVCSNGTELGEKSGVVLDTVLAALINAAERANPETVLRLLHELVPEYRPEEAQV